MKLFNKQKWIFILALLTPVLVAAATLNSYEDKIEYAAKYLKQKPKNALEVLDQAILQEPLRSEAYLIRGQYWYGEGSVVLGGEDFKRGVDLIDDPELRAKEAQRVCNITTRTKSSKERGYIKDALASIDAKKYSQAISSLADALKANSKNSDLYYYIGYTLVEMQRYKQAAYYLDKGRAICPMHKQILTELLHLYGLLKKTALVDETYLGIVKYYGEDPKINYDLAVNYIQIGENAEKSKRLLENNIAGYPDYWPSYFLLSELYIAGGQCHLALPLLDKFAKNIDTAESTYIKSNKDWYKAETAKMIAECRPESAGPASDKNITKTETGGANAPENTEPANTQK